MKWLIPIVLGLAGAATAVVLAKRSSSPMLRAYAGGPPVDAGGDAFDEEEEIAIATYTPTVQQVQKEPVDVSTAPVIPIATPHDKFSVTQTLAPTYRQVLAQPAPQWVPREAQ